MMLTRIGKARKDRELTTEEQREERNKERGGQKERKEKREGKNEVERIGGAEQCNAEGEDEVFPLPVDNRGVRRCSKSDGQREQIVLSNQTPPNLKGAV